MKLNRIKELLGSQLVLPTVMSCQIVWYNLTVQLLLEIAADLSLQRRVKPMAECLMRCFAALQESPLPDCCCENPDRTCRSKRPDNFSASWCKTNTVFMLFCGPVFVCSRTFPYYENWKLDASTTKQLKAIPGILQWLTAPLCKQILCILVCALMSSRQYMRWLCTYVRCAAETAAHLTCSSFPPDSCLYTW